MGISTVAPAARQADGDRRPAGPQAGDGLLQRFRAPHRLDRPVHAAGHRSQHGRHGVVLAGVDDVRGTQVLRELKLGRVDVDRDDRVRAREPGAHDRGQPDPAGAEDEQRPAGALPDDIEHGADSGDDGAAGDGGDLRRHPGGDRDDRLLGDHDLLGEARDAHEVVHLGAVEPQPRRAVVGQAAGRGLYAAQLTHDRLPGEAVRATAAARPPQQRNGLACADALDAGADLRDHPRALVPQHDGKRAAQVSGHVVQVAVAHAGGLHADADLAGSRALERHVLKAQRRPDLVQDRGLHALTRRSAGRAGSPGQRSSRTRTNRRAPPARLRRGRGTARRTRP